MLERVIEIIQEQLNLDGVEITEDSSFKDDLGADSLDLFELVMAFDCRRSCGIYEEQRCRGVRSSFGVFRRKAV